MFVSDRQRPQLLPVFCRNDERQLIDENANEWYNIAV